MYLHTYIGPGQGRAGRAGQGRAGQGRAGQGRVLSRACVVTCAVTCAVTCTVRHDAKFAIFFYNPAIGIIIFILNILQ